MNPRQITCRSCLHQWRAEFDYSVYSQQAIESCPCPACGAYTLTCTETVNPLAPTGFSFSWTKTAARKRASQSRPSEKGLDMPLDA